MKKVKTVLSLLMAAVLLIAALPTTVSAADGSVQNAELAVTSAEADAAATGQAMWIRRQPPKEMSISGSDNPIYPTIVFGVGGGTGDYTFEWYYDPEDEYAIGEKVASTVGPLYQPTVPGYYHCWVHDSGGDSVFSDRTRVFQRTKSSEPVKAHIAGTRLEWFESAATGVRETKYEITVNRKDVSHNDTTVRYSLGLYCDKDGDICGKYGYHGNGALMNDNELNTLEATYDEEKHLYSINIDYLLGNDIIYDDIKYQFVVRDKSYVTASSVSSDLLSAKALHNGTIAAYFPTNLWREGEVQINDGAYIPGSVIRPNLTAGRWAGQESKVKVILQEYYRTDWSDVQEVAGAYTLKLEDVGKRLRFKVVPKNPYERYAGELYWEKEAFYSNWISVVKPVKYVTGTVNCTITEPKPGRKAATTVSFTDTNNKKYYDLTTQNASGTGLDWYFSNGQLANNCTFSGGETYTAEVYFELIHQDSRYTYNYDGLKVNFNGEAATVKRQGMNYLAAERSYTLPEVSVIDRAFINVTKPVAGAFPTFAATARSNVGWDVESTYSMGYYENGVLWRNVTDGYYMTSQTSDANNRFEKGKRYQVTVSLVVTSNAYVFTDKSLFSGSVNQNCATVGDYNDGDEGRNIYLQYTFDLDDVIRNMSFTVSEPAVGGKPAGSVDYPSGSRYSLFSTEASWYEDGFSMMKSDTFRTGHEYTVKFTVKADTDCYFTDETVALINNHEATITEKWTAVDGTAFARIEYTFSLGSGRLLGDVDNDKKVDVFDASAIQKSIAGAAGSVNYSELSRTDIRFKVADIDKNGTVDIFDASLIQKWIAGDAGAKIYGIGQTI